MSAARTICGVTTSRRSSLLVTTKTNFDRCSQILSQTGFAKLAASSVFVVITILALWSFGDKGIVYVLLSGDLSAAEKIRLLQEFFGRLGAAAPLAYVAMVTCEVVLAPLPGAMLYAPGGIIFGGFWGGLLSLAGNVLGAGLACQIMRTLGRPYIERAINRSSLNRYESRLARNGLWIVFLLRVNPLTSSDFVSYAAGATTMPLWKLMLGTLLGMAPLCWAQSYLANEILTAYPKLLYPLLAACVVYAIVVAFVVRKMMNQVAGGMES
jgi:uncharacterized membrane protein YdjX (TVP38/TMEM64 family)